MWICYICLEYKTTSVYTYICCQKMFLWQRRMFLLSIVFAWGCGRGVDFRDFPQDRAHKLTPPLTSQTGGCQPEGKIASKCWSETCVVSWKVFDPRTNYFGAPWHRQIPDFWVEAWDQLPRHRPQPIACHKQGKASRREVCSVYAT